MIDALLAPLLAAHAQLQATLPTLLTKLKDTSIPLDTRWDAYTKLVEKHILVSEPSLSDGYLGEAFGHNRVSLYDDFNIDRYQSSSFPDMWNTMIDNEDEDYMWVYRDQTKRDAWRERVLASGFSGFTYDW